MQLPALPQAALLLHLRPHFLLVSGAAAHTRRHRPIRHHFRPPAAPSCSDCVISTLEGPGISKSECPTCKQPGWKNDLRFNHVLNNTVDHITGLQQRLGHAAGPPRLPQQRTTAAPAQARPQRPGAVRTADPPTAAGRPLLVGGGDSAGSDGDGMQQGAGPQALEMARQPGPAGGHDVQPRWEASPRRPDQPTTPELHFGPEWQARVCP